MEIEIVRSISFRRVYKEYALHLELDTLQCILLESLTLNMKVKVIDDLDDNWSVNVFCQPSYFCKNVRF